MGKRIDTNEGMTQKEIIYNHMRDIGAITPYEAINKYGITRLSAVIKDLKTAGVTIATGERPTLVTDRKGHSHVAMFAQYALSKNDFKYEKDLQPNGEEETRTQKQIVREHLAEYGAITPLEAINEYGMTRLSGVIKNLKDEGVDIVTCTKPTKVTNREGETHIALFAQYALKDANLNPDKTKGELDLNKRKK
jgi:predicted peroxiredoxin